MSHITQIDTSSPRTIAETAANFLYDARARLYVAKIIIEKTDSVFTGEVLKEDCVLYLIEDL